MRKRHELQNTLLILKSKMVLIVCYQLGEKQKENLSDIL